MDLEGDVAARAEQRERGLGVEDFGAGSRAVSISAISVPLMTVVIVGRAPRTVIRNAFQSSHFQAARKVSPVAARDEQRPLQRR